MCWMGTDVCVWEGGDLVWADSPTRPTPPPPPPSSELMRGFLVLFLASRSWRAVRGRRESERERRGSGKRKRSSGWMRKRERWKKEKRGERGERGVFAWRGGGEGVPMRTSTAAASTHKAPRCEGSESWPDSQEKTEKGAPCPPPNTHTRTHTERERDFSLIVIIFHLYFSFAFFFFQTPALN